MKTNGLLITLICGLSLLTSCSDSDDSVVNVPDNTNRGERVAVVFDSPSISMITRATDVEFENGNAINITAVNVEETGSDVLESTNYADNVQYVSDGTKFMAAADPIYQYNLAPLHLVYYAVYPYRSTLSCSPEFIFNVVANQGTHEKFSSCDLAMQKLASNAQNVELELKHMLCNVEIIITGLNLNQKAISNPRFVNMCYSSVVNQNTQTVAQNGNYRLANITPEVISNTNSEYSFHAIVVPQQIEALQHFVTVNMGGVDKELKSANPVTLVSGHRYRFLCSLNGDGVSSNLSVDFGGIDETGNKEPSAREFLTEWE